MQATPHIIVIGAGISGLAAARRLRERGCRVTVLERSDRVGGRATSDQFDVWDHVSAYVQRTGTESPTGAMHDAVEQRRESLNAYVEALECPQEARGVVVAIDGKFVAMDLFDKPDTLQRAWKRLVTGYAMDAIVEQDEEAKPFAAGDARTVISQAGDLACEPCPSVGVGVQMRCTTPGPSRSTSTRWSPSSRTNEYCPEKPSLLPPVVS